MQANMHAPLYCGTETRFFAPEAGAGTGSFFLCGGCYRLVSGDIGVERVAGAVA